MSERHEQFATSQEDVFSLVASSTGKEPLHRIKIVQGMDNEVYRVETEQGQNFIVRIHRFGEVKPSQEIWAMEESRKAGAPIPEVFFAGSLNLPDGEHKAMVLSEIKGRPLSAIKDRSELEQAIRNAGKVLRKIHSVKAGGFYQRQADGVWDFPTWERLTDSMVEHRAKEKDLILPAGFSEQDFEFMLKMIAFYIKELPCAQPVLNHGDYLPDHIFADDNLEISGVIDFGMFQGGPPIHDFAYFSFEEPDQKLNEALKEGYGDHEMFHDRFDLRLSLHKLPLQMGHLAHETRQENTEVAATIAKSLQRTLADLRGLNENGGS